MQRSWTRPKSVPQLTTNDGGLLRTTLFLALFGYASTGAGATVNWDGETLIPLGLQPRSEAVLRMPVDIVKYWLEEASTVSITAANPRTFTIKPTVPSTEQRLFLLGPNGKVYIAKLSTAMDYYPYTEVVDKTVVTEISATAAKPAGGAALPLPEAVLVAMMRNEPPAGFGVAASNREILKTDDYLIRASAVWSSPTMTGVLAQVDRQGALGREIKLSPTQIEVVIPEFGGACALIAADNWKLTDTAPRTKMYFLFKKL